MEPSQRIVYGQTFITTAVIGTLGDTAYYRSSLCKFSRVCGLTTLVLRHLPLGSVHNDRAQKMWACTARRNRRIARPATISTRLERSRLVTGFSSLARSPGLRQPSWSWRRDRGAADLESRSDPIRARERGRRTRSARLRGRRSAPYCIYGLGAQTPASAVYDQQFSQRSPLLRFQARARTRPTNLSNRCAANDSHRR
jgi:hypothetical protein